MAESVQIKTVGWWHEQLATWMFANPDGRLADAARYFDKSISWISIVKNSDAFKLYYANRSDQAFGGVLGDINQKTAAMTEIALDAINEKLERESSFLPLPSLLEIADTGLKRMGYGAKLPSQQPLNVNVGVVISQDELSKARAKMLVAHNVQVEEHSTPALELVDREAG